MPVVYRTPTHAPEVPTHYYGDIVRRCFLAAGVIMLSVYPFIREFIPKLPIFLSIAAVLGLALFAGLLNPRQAWSNVLDLVAAGVGVLVFAYYGIQSYSQFGVDGQRATFFFANQVLALLFLVAFYFSSKSVRGQYLQRKQPR